MKTIQAILLLSGMIIGVGMFGIPFSFVQAGFWLGTAELAVLAVVVWGLHRMYGEIVLATRELHRLPGYVRIHLGRAAMPFVWFTTFFGVVGSLLIYLLVGSFFADAIAKIVWSGSTQFFWAVVLYGLQLIVSALPFRKEAAINSVITVLFIGFVIGLIAFLLPAADTSHFTVIQFSGAFVPYGVLLFALSGGIVIPDVVTLVSRNAAATRRVILIGSILPAAVYALFAFAIVGISGAATSQDAITGLAPFMNGGILILGSVIGFLAIITSYLPLGESFAALLRLDFKLSKRLAWFAAATIPFILYLFGVHDFIRVMGAVGIFAVGVDIWLMVAMYHVIERRRGEGMRASAYIWKAGLLFLASAGVMYELYRFFL